jgi:hypothetical protein
MEFHHMQQADAGERVLELLITCSLVIILIEVLESNLLARESKRFCNFFLLLFAVLGKKN